MDPFAPINGISLERYAEIGAALDGKEKDKQATREVLAAEGVSEADWEAAKTGWTARMQDMSLMGRVATAFMPLYQAALAKKKGGAARVSYEDFVHVSALIKIYSFEGAMHASGLSQSEWAEAAGHWTQTMGQNMMQYAGHSNNVLQEEQRIRGGMQPRKIQVTRDSSAAVMQQPNAQQLYAQASMDPIAQAMQNLNGLLRRRLIDRNRLETPLKRRILLNIFAVFIQCGGADALQLAACQRRL